MVHYGSNTTDSSAVLLRQKTIRLCFCKANQSKVDRNHSPWVLGNDQLLSLYTPNKLPIVNKSSPLQDVKSALRRMRSAGSRFKLK